MRAFCADFFGDRRCELVQILLLSGILHCAGRTRLAWCLWDWLGRELGCLARSRDMLGDECLDFLDFFWGDAPALYCFAPIDDAPEYKIPKRELFAWTQIPEDFQRGVKGQVADYHAQHWQREFGTAVPIASGPLRCERA